jgi:hypothetical protein
MATFGTPWLGTGPYVSPAAPGPAGIGGPGPVTLLGGTINPWTSQCSLVGKTAVFLRLIYDPKYYTSGLPQISFRVRGKKDIYDPRLGAFGSPGTTAYTENAALCIADHLHDQTWGFKAAYGTEIPTVALSAEADVCDEAVTLANGGTEPRYACNGQFDVSMSRGEVLQNLLTSCAGRLLYVGGQFLIQAARWTGASAPAVDFAAIAAGPVRWRPTVSIRDLYNGVKGTYISPSNKWQATDFPYYAQDSAHGYSGPSIYGGDINLAADGGERRWLDIHLPFTISAPTAQRIAKIELLRRRQQGTGTLALNMAGYQFAALDVVAATQAFLGWSGKLLEIAAVRLRAEKQPSEGGGPEVVVLGCEADVQETDSSVYQWATTEELTPQGFIHTTAPGSAGFKEQFPFPWSPGYAKPLAGDAVYPQGATGPANFGLQPAYGVDAQGNATAALQIKGAPPINALDDAIGGPQIVCVASATGGSLAPGTYIVAVSAFDSGSSSHSDTEFLDVAVVEVAGSGAGSIAVSITWGSGDDGGELYFGKWNADGYVFHRNQALAPGAASATVSSLDESTAGGPDALFDHFAVTWQEVIHSGNWAAQVVSRTATTITVGGPGMTTNQWAGRVLSLLAKFDNTVEIPVLNMPVASSTASSGTPATFTLTIGPNFAGVQLPDLTTLLAVGDLVVMRFAATFTATSFSDPSIANPFYPAGATSVEAGHVAVVLTGADTGDVQTISDVALDGFGNSTILDLAGSWKITPAPGDLVIVCAPAAAPEVATEALLTRNGSVSGVVAQPSVLNLKGQTWLFRVRTEDVTGRSGPDAVAPSREVYIWGAQGTRTIAASTTQLPTDGTIQFDTSAIVGTTTTLSADISDSDTAITIADGSAVIDTEYIQIGTERIKVAAGGGTGSLTVERHAWGTTAVAHSAGDTVHIPGVLVFQCLRSSEAPNQSLIGQKVTSDINVVAMLAGDGDTFPGGGDRIYLVDDSAASGTTEIKFPG